MLYPLSYEGKTGDPSAAATWLPPVMRAGRAGVETCGR